MDRTKFTVCEFYAICLHSQQAHQRQKLKAAEELTNENNPVSACKEKAIYLLRFGGLTKVQLQKEVSNSKVTFIYKTF